MPLLPLQAFPLLSLLSASAHPDLFQLLQNTPEKKNAMDVVLCEFFPSLLFPHLFNRENSPNFASYNRQEVIGFVTTSRQDG